MASPINIIRFCISVRMCSVGAWQLLHRRDRKRARLLVAMPSSRAVLRCRSVAEQWLVGKASENKKAMGGGVAMILASDSRRISAGPRNDEA